jgi:peptide chain release factor 1
MNKSIAAKLTQLSVRLEELNRLLSSESITANLDNYRKLTRERAEIAPVVELYNAYLQSERDIHTAQEMSSDAEMREFADAEIRDAREKLMRFGRNYRSNCFPRTPTMSATFSLKFGLAPAETSRRFSPAIYSGCMRVLRNASAGRSK